MVKVTAPLFSQEAQGSLAGTLSFKQTATGSTCGKKPQPKHPQTKLQRYTQNVLTWVTQQWATLSTNEKESWELSDPDPELSSYNKFVKWNTARLRNLNAPSKAYPATETGNFVAFLITNAIGQVRHVRYERAVWFGLNQNWGAILLRSTAGDPPLIPANAVDIFTINDFAVHIYLDTPLDPLTYHYRLAFFTDTGRLNPVLTNAHTATVT